MLLNVHCGWHKPKTSWSFVRPEYGYKFQTQITANTEDDFGSLRK